MDCLPGYEAAPTAPVWARSVPRSDSLPNRDLSACAPDGKWLTDTTEFQIQAGKACLSPVIDYSDGLVVSWSIGNRPDAELVDAALDAAIETVVTNAHWPVVHSNPEGHYRSPGWLTRMGEAGLTPSLPRKACSPDNAACDGFFGRLKNKLFCARNRLNAPIGEFTAALDADFRWCNDGSIRISLGSRTPLGAPQASRNRNDLIWPRFLPYPARSILG